MAPGMQDATSSRGFIPKARRPRAIPPVALRALPCGAPRPHPPRQRGRARPRGPCAKTAREKCVCYGQSSCGSYTFVPLNSRLESNKEEEEFDAMRSWQRQHLLLNSVCWVLLGRLEPAPLGCEPQRSTGCEPQPSAFITDRPRVAHTLLYHSTLGTRVIKNKREIPGSSSTSF